MVWPVPGIQVLQSRPKVAAGRFRLWRRPMSVDPGTFGSAPASRRRSRSRWFRRH